MSEFHGKLLKSIKQFDIAYSLISFIHPLSHRNVARLKSSAHHPTNRYDDGFGRRRLANTTLEQIWRIGKPRSLS